MDFSPLVSEFHPRRKRLESHLETYGQKNPSRMETVQNVCCLVFTTDDISNMTDETDGKNDMEALTQCCVIFAVRCLMRVLADKKTRDSDIQTLVIDNLSLWSQVIVICPDTSH